MTNYRFFPLLHATCVVACVGSAYPVFAGSYGEVADQEESAAAAPILAASNSDAEEGWTFLITPQLWIPHIDSGGFAGGAALLPSGGVPTGDEFVPGSPEAVDPVDLQWGVQLAARKGRWVVGLSYQGTDFETRTNITYVSADQNVLFNDRNGNDVLDEGESFLNPGERATQEFVDTSRTDIDLAASYLIPDVIPNKLDMSIGGGFKLIYADSVRMYANVDDLLAEISAIPGSDGSTGLYVKCKGNAVCNNGIQFDDRVKSTTWMYGVTVPMSAVTRLNDDGTWLFPISVAPFIGAETRQDHNVIYAVDPGTGDVDREDGTFFAYGVTADATLRVALMNNLWAYAGFRVQYMNGESPNSDAYLAYGPLLGLSASFTKN